MATRKLIQVTGADGNDYDIRDEAAQQSIGTTALPTTAQTLSGAIAELNTNKVPNTRKVNNKALSSDVTLVGSDIPVSALDNTKLDAALGDVKSAITLINMDYSFPLESGYYTLATAIAAIPAAYRKVGLIITFHVSNATVVQYQYKNSSLQTSVFENTANWTNYIGDLQTDVTALKSTVSVLNIDKIAPLQSGYYTLATAIAVIPSEYRFNGVIITYKTSANSSEQAQYSYPSMQTANFEDPTKWKRNIKDLQEEVGSLSDTVEEHSKKWADGIEPGDTTFMVFESNGPNLFDKRQPILSKTVYKDDGSTEANNNYDSLDAFIDVSDTDGAIAASASLRTILEYNASKERIATQTYKGKATLNANTKYIKVSFATGTANTLVIVAGNTQPTEYIPYYKKYSFDPNLVDFSKGLTEPFGVGSNIFDEANAGIETGIFNADGTTGTNNNYNRTMNFIPVEPNTVYTQYVWDSGRSATILNGFRSIIYYDKDKQYIDGWSNGSGMSTTIKTPANCYYIRFAYYNAYAGYVYVAYGNYKYDSSQTYKSERRFVPTIIEPDFSIINSWHGKTVIGLGDSITQADGCMAGWLMRMANYFGMVGINYGINGSTVAVKESDPTTRYPMVTRYDDMTDDADIVIVLGGSNDWYYAWTPIGTMDDRTNYTFYGALHNLITGLIQKYENGKVVFATPIKRTSSATYENALGYTLEQYCDIIKQVCAYYGVPCIDSNKMCQLAPFIEWQNTKYFLEVSDGHGGYVHDYTHPNDAGHEKIAELFVGQIRALYP